MRKQFEEQMQSLNNELISMGSLCEEAISDVIDCLTNGNDDKKEKIADIEKKIDKKERDIELLCTRLLLKQQPVATDLRIISAALRMISDMERIGDQASDISEMASYVNKGELVFKYHLSDMAAETTKMVTTSIDSFVKRDVELAAGVVEQDDVVDEFFNQIKSQLIASVKSDEDDAEALIDLFMIAKYFERIGDHAVNVAESVIACFSVKHSS